MSLKASFTSPDITSFYSGCHEREFQLGPFPGLPNDAFAIVTSRIKSGTPEKPHTMGSFCFVLDTPPEERFYEGGSIELYIFPIYKAGYTEIPSYSDNNFNGIDEVLNPCAVNCLYGSAATDAGSTSQVIVFDHVPMPPSAEFVLGIRNQTGAPFGKHNRLLCKFYSFSSKPTFAGEPI